MKSIGLICLLLIPCSLPAQARGCDSLDTLQWLVGDWQSTGQEGIVLESWEKTSALTYEGVGITLSHAGEELSREGLRLLVMKDQIFYLAKVDHNALPIPFVLTHCLDDRLVFQNPQHDFPKMITYEREGDNQLTVTLSDGNERSSTMIFEKQPD